MSENELYENSQTEDVLDEELDEDLADDLDEELEQELNQEEQAIEETEQCQEKVEDNELVEESVKEENISVFEKEESGIEYTFYGEETKEEKHDSEPLFGKEDYVERDDNPILFTNPFLYNIKDGEDTDLNIEEFAVKYKKSNVYLGSIVHNDKIEKKERIKLVKKSFKTWKNGYQKRCRDVAGITNELVDKVESTPMKITGGIFVLFLIIFLILEVAFALVFLNVLPVEFLNEMSLKLQDGFNNDILYKVGIILPIASFALMIIARIVYSFMVRRFKKLKKKTIKSSKKISKGSKKEFKKNYKKAYKYYISNMNKEDDEMFAPMRVNEISCNHCDLTNIEKLIEKYVTKKRRKDEVDADYIIDVEAFDKCLKSQRKKRLITKIITMISLVLFIVGVILSLVLCVLTLI